MELHHSKHHNTYVTSYNAAAEKLAAASDSPTAQISLQPLINFHGGGHINHSLFWENLAPKNAGGGEPPSGKLGKAIQQTYGSVEALQKVFGQKLAGIQGSGWAWLVKDTETGEIGVKTYAVSSAILDAIGRVEGIKDMIADNPDDWEVCRTKIPCLQYENRKAEYFNAIWDVINWKAAEKRFG
ncbi:hypothetical protein MMC07_001568 [Pseudocyphellaria aurata]|nr:hypothetical protein [Pseudocyphellaria aurata]